MKTKKSIFSHSQKKNPLKFVEKSKPFYSNKCLLVVFPARGAVVHVHAQVKRSLLEKFTFMFKLEFKFIKLCCCKYISWENNKFSLENLFKLRKGLLTERW